MDLDQLLSVTKSDDYQPMVAGNFGLSRAYGYGEAVARDVGMERILDLHDLIVANGGRVHYVDYAKFLRFEKDGVFDNSIYVHKERDFDIILPSYAPLVENRYTMAHELGHYVLHAKGKCYARRNGTDLVEQEATCFALGFLMPSEMFKDAYLKCNKNVRELSIAFLLPVEIVSSRVRSLNLS